VFRVRQILNYKKLLAGRRGGGQNNNLQKPSVRNLIHKAGRGTQKNEAKKTWLFNSKQEKRGGRGGGEVAGQDGKRQGKTTARLTVKSVAGVPTRRGLAGEKGGKMYTTMGGRGMEIL